MVGGAEGLHGEAALPHPLDEYILALTKLPINHGLRRKPEIAGVAVNQEDQAGKALLRRCIKFQFGVRHLGPITHWRAITQAKDPHIHIAAAHLLRTQTGGLLVGGGEINHVHNRVAGRAHRPLGPIHNRRAWSRELTQLRGMGEKDTPGGLLRHTLVNRVLAELTGLSVVIAGLPARRIGGTDAGDGG